MVFHGNEKFLISSQNIKEIGCLSGQPTSYEKVEFKVKVEGLCGNLFDYEHISLDLIFNTPSGKTLKHPAFYYRGFEFKDGRVGAPIPEDDAWRIRLTPREVGLYKAVLRLTVDGTVIDEVAFDFETVKGSNTRGQVTVDPVNRRSFCFEDGTPYTAIGENVCWTGWSVVWPEESRGNTSFMEDIYNRLADHKANWTRLWMSERFNWLIPTGGTDNIYPNLDRAIINDRLLSVHEERGLYLDLVLFYHAAFCNGEGWKLCPFNKQNGGYLDTAAEFFRNPRAIKDAKMYVRYMIARYGYSKNLFCWELFNEGDMVDADPDDVLSWHREIAQFIRENDCHGHMITTSAARNRSPLIFDDIYDFISMHRYGEPDNIKLIVHEAYMAVPEYNKPVLMAESGNSWRGPHLSLITRHQSVWVGIMGNTAGTAMNWWWDRVEGFENEIGQPLSCYKDFAIAADFAARIPRNKKGCRFVMREPLACNRPFVEALGYNGPNYAYIWFYDSRYTRKNPVDEEIEFAEFEVRLENGDYTVQWIDPWTGDTVEQTDMTVKGCLAHITGPSFRRDIAIAIEKK